MKTGPRALGMAQPRPRRRRRVRGRSADRRDAVGLVPPQLDRSRARRRACSSRRAAPGPATSSRAAAAAILWRLGGTKSSFKMGPGTEMAWQHDGRMLARRRDHVLRRRLEPADPPPVARRADRARLQDPSRAPRVRLHAPQPAAARREPGQHADAPRRQHASWATAGCRRSASTRATARCCSTPTAVRHVLLPGLPLPLERAPAEPAGGARQPQQHRRRDDRARELERRHRGRLLARAGGAARRIAAAASDDPARAASRARSTLPQKYAYVAVQALDSAGHVLGSSRTAVGDQLRRLAEALVMSAPHSRRELRGWRRGLSRPVWSCASWSLSSSSGCRSWPVWRSCCPRFRRRIQRPRGCSPGRPGALAWRSVAFSSWAGLQLSLAGSAAAPYQAFAAPIAVAQDVVSVGTATTAAVHETPPAERKPRLRLGLAAGGLLRGPVHGHPRPEHRQRRAALDPVEPRLLLARTAVGRRRLRDHVRGLPDARRARRRPLRAAPDVRRGAAAVRARLAGRRRSHPTRGCWSARARCRASPAP